MQFGGDLGEIAAKISLELQRNLGKFTLATKVELESATKIAAKIACVNGPLHSEFQPGGMFKIGWKNYQERVLHAFLMHK